MRGAGREVLVGGGGGADVRGGGGIGVSVTVTVWGRGGEEVRSEEGRSEDDTSIGSKVGSELEAEFGKLSTTERRVLLLVAKRS